MDKANRIECEIGSRSYVLISEKSREEVMEIVNYIDGEIEDAKINNRKLNSEMQAVLATVNITDKFFNLREEYKNLKKTADPILKQFPNLSREYENLKELYESKSNELEGMIDSFKNLEKKYDKTTKDYEYSLDRIQQVEEELKKHNKDLVAIQKNLEKQQTENLVFVKENQDLKRYIRQLENKVADGR